MQEQLNTHAAISLHLLLLLILMQLLLHTKKHVGKCATTAAARGVESRRRKDVVVCYLPIDRLTD